MQFLIDSYKKNQNLHHAYCCEGEKETIIFLLKDFFEKTLKIKTQGNPDFWLGEFDVFGIDDGRFLNALARNRSFDGRKIFVFSVNNITHEAQNSLLKMLEEPTVNTHFFIITRSSDIFLPTLRSRLMFIKQQKKLDADEKISSLVFDFLKKRPSARIDLLDNIIQEKNKKEAMDFLDDLISVLNEKIKKGKKNTEDVSVILQLIKNRDYINDRSSSVKMILEHISNIVPIM